ncbi:MraY family glycosyltransferase [Chitinilyticum piscinae]|uniref:Glycosyltransferase family 4 protein n=1 Tax=Chitinilyticum piscinae TaxID=2866724 RepID=A0A8J7KGS5_9NEIS|nr:glycosyltransferase [Chitinilyticum piscinae]MBE9610659.1 glycosyltransferase family 4 protein [Chitinilyticum piscinae]
MQVLFISFLLSFLCTMLIIRTSRWHGSLSADHDLGSVQKFHAVAVPRIGGVAVIVGLLGVASWYSYKGILEARAFWLLILVSLPAFLGGLVEDLTKYVSPLARLLATMAAAMAGFWLLDASINRLDVPLLEPMLQFWPVALLFTAVAVAGVANAVNIIDGYNGLAAMVSVMIFAAFGYVGWQLQDPLIWRTSFAMIGAILGFFVWNFPRGLVFLGDGGAYLIGFMVGEMAVLLVARHEAVSPWFPLLVVIYPVFETLFSIYRKRFVRGMSPSVPDGVHLHMLVYKRLVRWTVGGSDSRHRTTRNALTSPYLWLLCSLSIFPAVLFWQQSLILQLMLVVFILIYVVLYRALVLFKVPRWLVLRNRRTQKK